MYEDTRPAKRPRSGGEQSTNDSQFVSASDFTSTFEGSGKRREGKKQPLSCAECRRLKLKCDRVFPCQSCSKRGCAEICPNGSLTSGKGSRFILANTEQLHQKIIQMSERIRQLEDAVESLQASFSSDRHPLLRQELLLIKTTLELHGPQQTAEEPEASSSSTRQAIVQPASAPGPDPISGLQDIAEPAASEAGSTSSQERRCPPEVPADIFELSEAFPVPWSINLQMRQRIRGMLPTRERAEYLCEQARVNALWQYNLDPSETFLPNMVRHVYTTPLQTLCPRRLALILMILAIGSRVDLNQPADSPYPELYHHLARASVCELPVMYEPNYDMLHALFYMTWYLLIFSEESSALGVAWGIMGLAAKLAQSIGLHRDKHAKSFPEEVQGRRMLFWEFLNLDARLALCLGRPPSLSLKHVECKRPSYTSGEGVYNVGSDVSYHDFKHGFYAQCLSPVLEAGVAAHPPQYSYIIDLDKTVREYRVPPSLDLFKATYTVRPLVMQSAIAATGREIALLQLHRPYFTQAVSGPERFSLRHRYAPSVLATFKSARQLISAIETIYSLEPQLSARFLMFWFNAISGAVALCLLVSRAPFSSLAPFALRELERVCRLFATIAEFSPKAAKALPLLAKLTEKSRRIYLQWYNDESTQMSNSPYNALSGRSEGGPEAGPDPFENVHPSLLQCLMETKAQLISPIQEPSAFTSAPAALPNTWQNIDEQSPGSLSQGMLNWYMGSENFANVTVASTGSLNDSRVPNHQTFNLDFGALTSDLNNQSWMSWF